MKQQTIGAALALLMSCSVAYADAIVVTGGSLSQTGVGGNQPFTLEGDGLLLSGIGYENFVGPVSCNPCFAASSLISFNALLNGFVPAPTSGTVDGKTFQDVFLAGIMSFSGPSFPASLVLGNDTLTAPFTFLANLRGFENSSLSGAPVFDSVFVGRGTATADYTITPGPGAVLVSSQRVTYQFESGPASPTPEPESVWLLMAGAVSLCALYRRAQTSRGVVS